MIHQLKTSFAGGEISPSMYGRVDLQKYDASVAELTNFLVLRSGGIANRPGLKFVSQTSSNKRAVLIPFRYNAEQNFIIEITAGKFRFYTNQAQVKNSDGSAYEISNSFAESELETIKYTQSADVMFLAQPNHAPMTLTRYGTSNWKFETAAITGGPMEDSVYGSTTQTKYNNVSLTPSGTTGTITLTASSGVFSSNDVGKVISINQYVQSQYKKGLPGTDNLEIQVLPKSSCYIESFGFWNGNFSIEKYDDKTKKWVLVREQNGNRTQNYNFTEKNDTEKIVNYRVTSTEFNIDVWSGENEKQRGYVVIQAFGNDYEGLVKVAKYVSSTQVTGTVQKRLGSTTATYDYAFSSWDKSKGFPACVNFFEDRLVFAGSASSPQTFWTSRTGDYFNFGTSIPTLDDDAVTATLNGGQMNGIKAIVSFDKMVMLTSGGEYLVGGEGTKALSPSSVNSSAQEFRGINNVDPVVVGNRIVYIQQQGNVVRDLGYQYDVDKYTGADLNILADHLFANHKIVRMAFQQVPNSIVWCVRDDGMLLGMTYIKDQDVYAWHKHTTDGEFVDVCCIAGTKEDELWCVVKRNGKYFVERMEHRDDTVSVSEQYFLDCGVTVRNTGKTISGLTHLAGRTVSVLADGNVIIDMQVSSTGTLSLGADYSVVSVGLPYTAQVTTLPVEITGQDGSWMARKKAVSELAVLFKNTRGGEYGVLRDFDEIKWRSTERWGAAIQLFSGIKKITLPNSGWDEVVQITITQNAPLPITVLALVPTITTGG